MSSSDFFGEVMCEHFFQAELNIVMTPTNCHVFFFKCIAVSVNFLQNKQ